MSNGVQYGVEGALGLLVTIGGAILAAFRADHKALQQAHEELVDSLPSTYARRDDVRDAVVRIEAQHTEMNRKLDQLLMRH